MGIAMSVVALIIFQAGQATGFRKAKFAGNFGNNFERNFMGPERGMMDKIESKSFGRIMLGGHGAVGEITSLSLPQIVVLGPDNIEKIVVLSSTTQIHEFSEVKEPSDLKIGVSVVILGSPNESGQIEAKLIRIMPTPNQEFTRKIQR